MHLLESADLKRGVRLGLWIGLTLLAGMVLVSSSAPSASAAEPIRIGVVFPLSSPGAVTMGQEAKAGVDIAQEMMNERGGLLGRLMEMIVEDTQGLPERGRAAFEKLITKEKVAAIVGEVHSSVCMAETEVAKKYNVPFVNVNCWADAIREKGYRQVFNTSNYNARAAHAMAELIAWLGAKRIVAFAENTDWGIGEAKLIEQYLKELAPDARYQYQVVDRTAKDFTPAILPLKAESPDLVTVLVTVPGGYIFYNQLYELGIAPTVRTWLLDSGGTDFPDFWDNVGTAGKYMLSYALYHPKMKLTELGKQVRTRYLKKFKHEPNRLVFQGFDALWVLADAIKRAGSLEADKVIEALEKTKVLGTRGVVTFSNEPGIFYHQWVNIPYIFLQFSEVKQKLVEAPIIFPPDVAETKPIKPR